MYCYQLSWQRNLFEINRSGLIFFRRTVYPNLGDLLLGLSKGNARVEIPAWFLFSFGRKSQSSPHHAWATFQGRPGGVVEYQYTRKKIDKIPQNTPNSSKYTQK